MNEGTSDNVNLTPSGGRVAKRHEPFGPPALPLLFDIARSKADPLLRKQSTVRE
jgi:hypothetical protein